MFARSTFIQVEADCIPKMLVGIFFNSIEGMFDLGGGGVWFLNKRSAYITLGGLKPLMCSVIFYEIVVNITCV